jgi:Leucine-rich repeat (LRR) protein
VNYTPVATLAPLDPLTHLEKVYCDHTAINRAAADAFMASHPGVLVIFDSEDLKGWWDTLPAVWQKIFRDAARTAAEPGKEELARITTLDSINLGGNTQIRSLDPLEKLTKLKVVIAAKTSVRDLMALQDHQEIRTLDIRDTPVDDLAVVGRFKKLTTLYADGTKIQTLEPLASAGSLRKVYADQTAISDEQARQLLRQHTECLVVYKTDSLQAWWNGVTEDWKEIFNTQLRMQTQPTREDLHRLVELKSIHAGETRIQNLTPLHVFIRLAELHFSGTAITDITPLTKVKTLTSLHLTHSPLRKLDPLVQLTNLEDLDISNTPTEDLKPLGSLQNLKKLNCAGTQIKTLTALETLRSLEFLDCSNTEVKKIDPLQELPMKTLKCYNTKISAKQVESFQKIHPDCQVMYYR